MGRWKRALGRFELLLAALLATSSLRAEVGPVGHWVFDRASFSGTTLRDRTGAWPGTLVGPVTMLADPECLLLDGEQNVVRLAAKADLRRLPQTNLSVAAWVALRSGGAWGAIIGCLQDNGDFERGWLLGNVNDKFDFAVATQGKLTYLTAPSTFAPDRWYHVAGTYDGAVMRLYVNGKVVTNSTARRGPIHYAPAPFVIGAYQDDNEFYPLDGYLREVRVYDRSLSDTEVADLHKTAKGLFPEMAKAPPPRASPELGPFVRFTGVSNAVAVWHTATEEPSVLEFGETPALGQRVADAVPKKIHSLPLAGLKAKTKYHYALKLLAGGQEASSEVYEFETDFNFSVPPVPAGVALSAVDASSVDYAWVARSILAQTGVRRGYALDYGCTDARLALELARRSDLNVFAVSDDAEVVDRTRRALQGAGVYGWRVTVHHGPLDRLPYTKDWFNLIVSSAVLAGTNVPGQAAELLRVLRPAGGVALLGWPDHVPGSLSQWPALEQWVRLGAQSNAAAMASEPGRAVRLTRGPLPGAGEWSHNYGDAAQTVCSSDQRVVGRGMRVQWFGDPGPRGMTDRQARNPTPLMVNGTFYVQGNNRVTAQDAYNGRVYWSLETPHLRRVNIPRDGGNWCADRDSLYVAVRDKLWRLAARSGALQQSYDLPVERARFDWGYVASEGDRLYGSSVKKGSFYTKYDGGWDYWYDSPTSLNEIAKICSEHLFCLAKTNGARLWLHTNGLIVNSTLALGGGRVYFVDSRSPELAGERSGRIRSAALWSNNHLVALEAATGAVVWERPIAPPATPYPVVIFLCYADEKLVISTSTTRYGLVCHSAANGRELWTAHHPWKRNHHGGHMYHPLVVGSNVIMEPFVYDLHTGRELQSGLPERGGCSTMSAAARAVHYINWDYAKGSMYFWDLDTDERRTVVGSRASCWLSVISGGGMVFIPAASAGCACTFPLQSTIGFVAP